MKWGDYSSIEVVKPDFGANPFLHLHHLPFAFGSASIGLAIPITANTASDLRKLADEVESAYREPSHAEF